MQPTRIATSDDVTPDVHRHVTDRCPICLMSRRTMPRTSTRQRSSRDTTISWRSGCGGRGECGACRACGGVACRCDGGRAGGRAGSTRAAAVGRWDAPVRPRLVDPRSPLRQHRAARARRHPVRACQTPIPSDSFPGLVGQITGGNPATTGIYYDDTYNRSLLPPGSACTVGQTTGLGSEVNLAENLDVDSDSIDAGFGIANLYAGLPSSVLALPGDIPTIDQKMIDRGEPSDRPGDLQAGLPPPVPEGQHDLRGRARSRPAHGLDRQARELRDRRRARAAPASTISSHPRSTAPPPIRPCRQGRARTGHPNNQDTQFYDEIKVDSIINEINGFDHGGTTRSVHPRSSA